jgi:hypothetical protein
MPAFLVARADEASTGTSEPGTLKARNSTRRYRPGCDDDLIVSSHEGNDEGRDVIERI